MRRVSHVRLLGLKESVWCLAVAFRLAQQRDDVPVSLEASCTPVLEMRPLLPKVRPSGVGLPETPRRHDFC